MFDQPIFESMWSLLFAVLLVLKYAYFFQFPLIILPSISFIPGKIAPNMTDADSPIDLITTMGNLISCDMEMLVLDLHTLFGNYPSLTEDHLVRLFHIRNDIKSNEVKTKIQDAIKSKKSKVSVDKQDVVFKEIVFSDKLW